MIFLAPFLFRFDGGYSNISYFIYNIFSSTCHQIDERSFHLFGSKLAVCSRCFAVYSGFLLSVFVYPLFYKLNNEKMPPSWILLIVVAFLILDGGLDLLGIFKNTFFTRIITGSLAGIILPLYIIPGFTGFVREIKDYFKNKKSSL